MMILRMIVYKCFERILLRWVTYIFRIKGFLREEKVILYIDLFIII